MSRRPFWQREPKEFLYFFSLPTVLPLKDFVSYEDEDLNAKGEGLNEFDPPTIFDDYGDEQILSFKDYGDEELLNFKELGEALVTLSC